MKIIRSTQYGFTLAEMMMSLGCATIILGAVVVSGVALQKSFAAVEAYSTTEADQLRVLDYIAMDCRRGERSTVGTGVNATTTPAVVNGSWVNGTWTLSSSSPQTLLLSLPVYYASLGGSINTPTISSSGLVTYGTGSVTVSYFQSGNNFNREVVILDASGNVTRDTTASIATNVSSFTVTPLNNTAIDGTVSCNIMFFPTFSHMKGNGTWRSGLTNPDTVPTTGGVDGDWYVINSTATDQTTVGNVYFHSGGQYSLLQNVKATTLYCNTFMRTPNQR